MFFTQWELYKSFLSGIKHPLYLTNSTSNPFQIRQEDNGDYSFPQLVTDGVLFKMVGLVLIQPLMMARGLEMQYHQIKVLK